MQTTSQTYKDILASGKCSFSPCIAVSAADGSGSIPSFYADKIISLKTDNKIYSEEPTIGGVYCGTCEFSLLDDGSTIPRMARCVPQYCITDGVNTSEYHIKGQYYIDTRKVRTSAGGITIFEAFCYDAMVLANKPYTLAWPHTWPYPDTAVINEICAGMGVTADAAYNSQYITQGFYLGAPQEGETFRDYLSYIGVMYGGNWIIADSGKLRFIPLGGASYDVLQVFPSDVSEFEYGPVFNGYSKVRIKISDDEYVESGLNDSKVLEAYCPFANQTIADYAFDRVGYAKQPFTMGGVWSDPAVELNDIVRLSTDKSDPDNTAVITAPIVSRVIDFSQGMPMELSIPNGQDVDHEFYFDSPTERQTETSLGDLTAQVGSIGGSNLIIYTKEPDTSYIPQLAEQLSQTYYQNYTPSVATHGMRFTKGSSTSASVLFQMGYAGGGNLLSSMNGLVAGQSYTLAFDWSYKLFAASSDDTYMRWRLLSYDDNTALATLTPVEFMRETITRNTDMTKSVSGTFTVPDDAVVCCLYMDFVTSDGTTDTVIANSAVRSTDYYEFANLRLVNGLVAPNWSPAYEDTVGVGRDGIVYPSFTYPANGLLVSDLVDCQVQLNPTNGTSRTYTLTQGTYLLTIVRYNSTSTVYDGVWLVQAHATNSHLTQIIKGSSAASPSISALTLSLTTTSANQRVTITRLG